VINDLKAALAGRGIELVHAADGREALRLILQRIPLGASVMNGGSATLEEIGVLDALGQRRLQMAAAGDRRDP